MEFFFFTRYVLTGQDTFVNCIFPVLIQYTQACEDTNVRGTINEVLINTIINGIYWLSLFKETDSIHGCCLQELKIYISKTFSVIALKSEAYLRQFYAYYKNYIEFFVCKTCRNAV